MGKRKAKTAKSLSFRNKLILNQWMLSLFGIDPLIEHRDQGKPVRPFHKLAEPIRDSRLEGLDSDNLHHFYHHLAGSALFSYSGVETSSFLIGKDMLLTYEQNIVRHTQEINDRS